jgi:shikimate kinase
VPESTAAPARRFRHVALVGAMGSGKTTIGVPLAAALHRPFVDNDAQLLARTGATAAELAARDGVDAMHAAEAGALRAALDASEPSVIAAAASTIADPAARTALRREAFVVWLRASPQTLAARLPGSATRPFADERPADLVADQARERDPLFEQVADLAVESDRSTPAAVVARLLEELPGH